PSSIVLVLPGACKGRSRFSRLPSYQTCRPCRGGLGSRATKKPRRGSSVSGGQGEGSRGSRERSGMGGSGAPGGRAARGHAQVGLVHPAAGIGGAMPALQGDRTDMLALFLVEHLEKRLGKTGTDLGRGPAKIQQAVAPIIEDRHGAPPLRFGLRVVKH